MEVKWTLHTWVTKVNNGLLKVTRGGKVQINRTHQMLHLLHSFTIFTIVFVN